MTFVISAIAGFAAAQSVVISLWQHVCAARFSLDPASPAPDPGTPAPTFTLLKPLKGMSPEILGSLESWLVQEYPGRVEYLFGVASAEDPAFSAVTELLSRHPGCDARVVVCPPNGASNPKVSTLIQLSALATSEVVLVSDADVRAPRELLRHVAATLRQPGVGLAHCLYRLAKPSGLAMRLESIGVNADFWAQVTQARSLGMVDFALGAVMGLRREVLQEIGGFQRIAHYLADDYQLGNLVSRTGRKIELCQTTVACFSRPSGWAEVWHHQLRWTRTVRICKPGPFLMSITGNSTLWPLLWVLTQRGSPLALGLFITWMLLRVALAHLRVMKLAGGSGERSDAWLAPVQDLFQATPWAAAQVGNHVTWQGRTYRVRSGGRMEPVGGAVEARPRGVERMETARSDS